ncbi:UNKNOWN [Stylonychia lemnae]|uniref:Uncharacterized protein n=1 Tax=Stylonychia lemnae TaxID=5949 RepID=A0A078AVB8_STYLE|nr:UNKNOWN [Stylonychia lemnae]|eukprot:CDW85976.1 UNKNOWN [Stylonychia lemnae]
MEFTSQALSGKNKHPSMLEAKRLRIYVTIEIKDTNIKKYIAVSEFPDKNISELKDRIENEFNALNPEQMIQVQELLLNDIFCITKDYSVGDILLYDQKVKVVAALIDFQSRDLKQSGIGTTVLASRTLNHQDLNMSQNDQIQHQKQMHQQMIIHQNASGSQQNQIIQQYQQLNQTHQILHESQQPLLSQTIEYNNIKERPNQHALNQNIQSQSSTSFADYQSNNNESLLRSNCQPYQQKQLHQSQLNFSRQMMQGNISQERSNILNNDQIGQQSFQFGQDQWMSAIGNPLSDIQNQLSFQQQETSQLQQKQISLPKKHFETEDNEMSIKEPTKAKRTRKKTIDKEIALKIKIDPHMSPQAKKQTVFKEPIKHNLVDFTMNEIQIDTSTANREQSMRNRSKKRQRKLIMKSNALTIDLSSQHNNSSNKHSQGLSAKKGLSEILSQQEIQLEVLDDSKSEGIMLRGMKTLGDRRSTTLTIGGISRRSRKSLKRKRKTFKQDEQTRERKRLLVQQQQRDPCTGRFLRTEINVQSDKKSCRNFNQDKYIKTNQSVLKDTMIQSHLFRAGGGGDSSIIVSQENIVINNDDSSNISSSLDSISQHRVDISNYLNDHSHQPHQNQVESSLQMLSQPPVEKVVFHNTRSATKKGKNQNNTSNDKSTMDIYTENEHIQPNVIVNESD